MGEKDDSKLMYSLDGKVFKNISEIPTLASGGIIDNSNELFGECGDKPELVGTIEFIHNRNYRRLIRLLQRLFPVPSNKSNNWLRMHGYPMIRKDR